MIIRTKTLPATDTKPKRVVAETSGGKLEKPHPYDVEGAEAHGRIAGELARSLGADDVRCMGENGSTGYTFRA